MLFRSVVPPAGVSSAAVHEHQRRIPGSTPGAQMDTAPFGVDLDAVRFMRQRGREPGRRSGCRGHFAEQGIAFAVTTSKGCRMCRPVGPKIVVRTGFRDEYQRSARRPVCSRLVNDGKA